MTNLGTIVGTQIGTRVETRLSQRRRGGGTIIWTPEKYLALDFGALVCWNMSTFEAHEVAAPELNPNIFAPIYESVADTMQSRVDDWVQYIKAAGMKYAMLTVKHHDGFCLWPTDFAVDGYEPYSIARTKWYENNGNKDFTKLFIDTCRANGITPFMYFSIWDLTWESRTGTDETTDAAAYIAMNKFQINELLKNYGSIAGLWIDGWGWHISFTDIAYAPIYDYVKSVSPGTLVINNCQEHPTTNSEIEVFEYDPPTVDNTTPGCDVKTIYLATRWFWRSANDNTLSGMKSLPDLRTELTNDNNRFANLLLGIHPDKNGYLDDSQKTILNALGNQYTPEAPITLTALIVSTTAVDLQWDNVSDDNIGTSIERSTDGVTYAEIDTVENAVNTYSDTGLTEDQSYFYRVRKYSGTVYSSYSNIENPTPRVLEMETLVLAALSDVAIDLAWTNNGTSESGISIQRSTDGFIYTEIDTVANDAVSYSDTGLSANTNYYYRVVPYTGSIYSDLYITGNRWTAMRLPLTATGDGSGVSSFRMTSLADMLVRIDGTGKFYDDEAGTVNEGTERTLLADVRTIIYLRVPSATANIYVFHNGLLDIWDQWTSSFTVGPKLVMDVANIAPCITSLAISGWNAITGGLSDLSDTITRVIIGGSNVISGVIADLPSQITLVGMEGTGNTIGGDLADLPPYITTINIQNGYNTFTYTPGKIWNNGFIYLIIRQRTGYGMSSTEVDNLLIDMSEIVFGAAPNIYLDGVNEARTSASDAAVASLIAKGVNVLTN